MGWNSAVKTMRYEAEASYVRPELVLYPVDWDKLVTIDFETFWDADYTLKKLSTSEYIRDPRFKAQQMGMKIGNKPTEVYGPKEIGPALKKINWKTHLLLCHNTAFDGFILSDRYGVVPKFYYDTLSMARGLHSNEIGASLDAVAQHYGKGSKIEGALERTKGVLDWPADLYAQTALYCIQDVDLTFEIFKEMHAKYPKDEIELIDLTMRMFCDPVLKVDIPRVQKELERELAERKQKLYQAVNPADWEDKAKELLKTGAERALVGEERELLIIKRVIGSNERFAELLRAEGVEPPMKVSAAWMKKSRDEQDDESKFTYAFAKDDLEFTSLPDQCVTSVRNISDIIKHQDRIQNLVDCRIAVKSTTNITRAERFLEVGKDGALLPVGYSYFRAMTGRFGGNNKMNMQNLKRGGELRQAILAPKGYSLCTVDSGQIECVARNSPVLTRDRGYVAIQDVKLTDRLWDGSAWVAHGGVVCTGFKEVITYDGVTATPEHKIWLRNGASCTLEEARKSKDRPSLAVGSIRGQAVRFLDSKERSYLSGDGYQTDLYLRGMSTRLSSVTKRSSLWKIDQVQKLRRKNIKKLSVTRTQVRRYLAKMPRPISPKLGDVWNSRNQMFVSHAYRIYTMDGKESPTQRLYRRGDRSDRQQWSLRTRKSKTVNSQRKRKQPTYDRYGFIRGDATTENSIYGATSRMRVRLGHNRVPSPQRILWRANNIPVQDTVQKSLVYDILNAGPRHRFTVSDRIVSNCRVNGWLWDQEDLLNSFQTPGSDPYCDFASLIYKRRITKADKLERFLGKVAILGLGYGMSALKFQLTLAKGMMGGAPIILSSDECYAIVNLYRRTNYNIVKGWAKCGEIIQDMAHGRVGSRKCIGWEKEKIWLPNDMSLKYPDLKEGVDGWSYRSGQMRKKIYSSMCDENVVQALARIIVMEQMLAISKKYRTVMTTHDEVTTCVKTSQADKCLEFMYECMTTPPSWCSDLPLACEGGHAVNYSK